MREAAEDDFAQVAVAVTADYHKLAIRAGIHLVDGAGPVVWEG
jgi:hypothetical protein